jgi:beta-phosphoglucomutase
VRPAALLFDFNGTLSADEHIQCEIYREIFADAGKPLTEATYFAELAGLSDPEIVETWLGEQRPDLVADRVRRYQDVAADGSTVGTATRAAVHYAAKRSRLGIVSGAARLEIDSVLTAAGLAELFSVVVAADDVAAGKPDPEGYVLALGLLQLAVDDVVAFEDSEAGVAAARAAGLSCIAVAGTMPAERLAAADEIVPALDVPLMQRLLG